jgi:aspartate/methionine/tyrosine aminotransferase
LNCILKKHDLHLEENFEKLKYIVFINPQNPLAKYITPKEWESIIPILQKYKNALIILDEAYSDITFNDDFVSLMNIAPDDVRKRIVLLRSGSKSFSIAGERIGVVISFNDEIMTYLTHKQLECSVHTSVNSQYIFTKTVTHVNSHPEDRKLAGQFYKEHLSDLKKIIEFFDFQSENMNYESDSCFFTFASFKKMIGMTMNKKACNEVYHRDSKVIQNDIDIFYHILFEYNFSLFSPCSNFGLPTEGCIFRLCVAEEKLVNKLKDVLSDINLQIAKAQSAPNDRILFLNEGKVFFQKSSSARSM